MTLIFANSTYENTSVINIEHKPWPMPTLERFKTFIKLKPEIDSYLPKLILFFNANTRFHKPVHLKDVLPDESQSLVGVQHPGLMVFIFLCPFERRKRLTCSLPWAYSKPYLQGCLLGGLSNAFGICHTNSRNLSTKISKITNQYGMMKAIGIGIVKIRMFASSLPPMHILGGHKQ